MAQTKRAAAPKQRPDLLILIDGTHWDRICALPCFVSMEKIAAFTFSVEIISGHGYQEGGTGDCIARYPDGHFEIIHHG